MRKVSATVLLAVWGYLFIGYLSIEPTNKYLEDACWKTLNPVQMATHVVVWPISYWAATTVRLKC